MNNNKNKVILYNLVFPIWLIVWFPGWWWLLLIPINFAVDYIVLKICFAKKKVNNPKLLLKKYSWKTCILGFLSDLLGSVFLLAYYFVISLIAEDIRKNEGLKSALPLFRWANSSMMSALDNPIAFITCITGLVIAAYFIFLFNRNMLRKNADIGEENAKYIARCLAVFTAPYLFLLPVYYFY